MRLLGKSRPVIISEENLPLLGTNFSYDEYDAYYNKHFAPLKIATSRLLTEPAEITTNAPKKALETEKEVDDYLDGTFISPDEKVDTPTQTVVPVDELSNEPAQTGTTIPVNDNDEGTNRQETIIPIGNDAPAGKDQNETIVPLQEEEKSAGTKNAKLQTTTVTTNGQDPVAKEPKAAAKRHETTKQAAATQKAQGKPAQAANKPAQSKPTQTAAKPATPTVKEEQKAQPAISNGAYIFFDDDTQVPPSKSPAKKKTADDASNKKKDTNKQEKDRTNKQNDDSQKTNDNKDPKDNTFDLEDEYYDLDGF